MPEFLLEFRSEEIPARMQARAADDLRRLMAERLDAAGLGHDRARAWSTPRRLALVVDGVAAAQPDRTVERRGPRVDAPAAAVDGFLGSVGIGLGQCERRTLKGAEYWFATVERPGRPAPEVLAELVGEVARKLPWPRSMRWTDGPFRWVRPLRSVLALFDGRPLPGGLQTGGLTLPFVDSTVGHRVHAPGTFSVTSFEDYRERLREARVLLDPAERRARIVDDAVRLVGEAGRPGHRMSFTLRDDPALLDEIAALVEWPVTCIGRFDAAFKDLPDEALAAVMRTHQKYLAVDGPDGELVPHFIFVADVETEDGDRAVVAGNERVLRARLGDARFFWQDDCNVPLRERVDALRSIVFHARLGTQHDRVGRLEKLVGPLYRRIYGESETQNAQRAQRAAGLCKADLVTGLVREFPDLQGIMGGHYAMRARGAIREPAIARAIAEHYRPAGPDDPCPTAPASVALALADRLDTLTGFFAVGEAPTGSKDPFALRRAALGVIRLIAENGLSLSLRDALHGARGGYGNLDDAPDATDAVLAFIVDRLKVHLRAQGVPHDHVAAVFALKDEDDLVRIIARAKALGAFLGGPDGAALLTACRRAGNIVRAEEKRDGVVFDGAGYDSGMADGDEQALATALATAERDLDAPLQGAAYGDAMAVLARLRGPVDRFFETVTVNADDADVRANRLRLLARIAATTNRIADFSRIEG